MNLAIKCYSLTKVFSVLLQDLLSAFVTQLVQSPQNMQNDILHSA